MEKEIKPTQNKNTKFWSLILLAIIDVPLILLLIFGIEAPPFFLAALIIIIILIDVLVIFFGFSGKRMSYKLKEKELIVSFGFSKRKIPYSTIQNTQIAQTELLLRLFGGSWPGIHWGYFKSKEIGNIWVYSTKIKGDFALIELIDGKKIVLSPENPEEFLHELNMRKNQFPTLKPEQIKPVSNRIVYLQVLSVTIAYLAFLGYLLWIYPTLPETIPVHFDFSMNPTRWGHKSELFIIASIAAIFPILNAILALKFGKYEKGLTIFLGIVFIATIALFFGIVYFTQTFV